MLKKSLMALVALSIVGMIAISKDALAKKGADNPPDPIEIETEVNG